MCLVTTGLLLVVVGFLAPLAQAADVQVVFVAGQSNCQGIADKLHLFELIDEGGEFARYGPHNDRHIDGREDVRVRIEPERPLTGPLSTRFGESNRVFGIEVGAGYELGDFFLQDEVAIIKHCEVSALAEDWLPPSASQDGQTSGSAYAGAMNTFRQALDQISDIAPNFDSSSGDNIVLLGFVWIHGYADAFVREYRDAYGERLTSLLADVRNEFPRLKGQVVVQLGGGGDNPEPAELEMRQIQAQVVQNESARVTLVETAGFSGGEPKMDETFVHYFGRADNYIRIGEAIGQALIEFDASLPPTMLPTNPPSVRPTGRPTTMPTRRPTASPTISPQPTRPPVPVTAPHPSIGKSSMKMMKMFLSKGAKGMSRKSTNNRAKTKGKGTVKALKMKMHTNGKGKGSGLLVSKKYGKRQLSQIRGEV